MHEQTPRKLKIPARCALILASSYLVVLGCLLLREAFYDAGNGKIAYIEGGEEQATQGYFFHVMAGLLAILWYARGSRSKFPMAFASVACFVAGMWTYVCFTPTFFGLAGLIPGAICGILVGFRVWSRRVENAAANALERANKSV